MRRGNNDACVCTGRGEIGLGCPLGERKGKEAGSQEFSVCLKQKTLALVREEPRSIGSAFLLWVELRVFVPGAYLHVHPIMPLLTSPIVILK